MKKIYLACPYFHEDDAVKNSRFEKVNEMAGKLMKEGYIVFSPLSHSVPIDRTFTEEKLHDFWLTQDGPFVDWADELWILTLAGWRESYGVNWEAERALKQGKPVRLVAYET